MMTVCQGLKRLHELYGNPRAKFSTPGQRLGRGQEVRVILEEVIVKGVVVRSRNKKGNLKVKYVDERNRVWFLAPERCQVLVEW